jgi:hypothetical protein
MSNYKDLSKLVDLLTEFCNKVDLLKDVGNKNALLKIEVVHRVMRPYNEIEHKSVIKEIRIGDDKITKDLFDAISTTAPRHGMISKKSLTNLLNKLQINVSEPKVVNIASETDGCIILFIDEDSDGDDDNLAGEGRDRPREGGPLIGFGEDLSSGDKGYLRGLFLLMPSQAYHPPPCNANEKIYTLTGGGQVCVPISNQ